MFKPIFNQRRFLACGTGQHPDVFSYGTINAAGVLSFILLAFCLLGLPCLALTVPAPEEHAFCKFNPGFTLASSLDAARTRAREQGKLVLLLASTHRSTPDSDSIGSSMEAFRAGALADSRVVKLINRRFVPYYFEMDNLSILYDQSAAEMMVRLIPALKFSATMPNPPLVAITPDGKSMGEGNIFNTADALLAELSLMIDDSEEYSGLNESEKRLDVNEQANILYELRKPDAALEIMGDDQKSASWFLRGVIAREKSDWAAMKGAFRMVTDEMYYPDIEMQEIYRMWAIGNYQGIKTRFSSLSDEFPCHAEACYYAGLAYYHSEEIERALEIWEMGIKAHPDSAWALRMDWTRGLAKDGPEKPLMLNSRPESLLGRRFLSPHGAWDLKPR